MYVDVVFKIPKTVFFSYFLGDLKFPGIYTRVLCPIGSKRKSVGLVVKVYSDPDPSIEYKEVIEFLDDSSVVGVAENLLATYLSKRYFCSLGESFSLFFPFIKDVVTDSPEVKKGDTIVVPYVLNEDQQKVFQIIQEEKETTNFLLHGITGSGKTHIYLKLIEFCVNSGKQAIVLLPEIALTPQIVSLFSQFWNICCINSKISIKKRLQANKAFFRGEIPVLVGTRSAIFAPAKNLGLIIVDEEHDDSFKNGSSPRYNAVPVAMQRAKICGAKLILGSATPSVDHFYYAQEGQKIRLVTLQKRFGGGVLPASEVIVSTKKKSDFELIDTKIISKLQEVIFQKKQAIVYLNRRAYHGALRCKHCYFVFSCKRCGIPFKYHKDTESLSCHYCGNRSSYEKSCPMCGRGAIEGLSVGVQKIVEELATRIPSAKILRADSDILNTATKIQKALLDFREGNYNILVGTQIVTKGHDFAKVHSVVILYPEIELSFGDYRCAERVYSHITQVSGRAGRREEVGEVLIQTSMKDLHYAIKCGQQQNYQEFYEEEIGRRKMFEYPPFIKLLKIVFRSSQRALCEKESKRTRTFLQNFDSKEIYITEPSPCAMEKINNKYRWWILIKSSKGKLLTAIGEKVQQLYQTKARGKKSFFHVEYDMDPIDFL